MNISIEKYMDRIPDDATSSSGSGSSTTTNESADSADSADEVITESTPPSTDQTAQKNADHHKIDPVPKVYQTPNNLYAPEMER